jgi:hypothetical protein
MNLLSHNHLPICCHIYRLVFLMVTFFLIMTLWTLVTHLILLLAYIYIFSIIFILDILILLSHPFFRRLLLLLMLTGACAFTSGVIIECTMRVRVSNVLVIWWRLLSVITPKMRIWHFMANFPVITIIVRLEITFSCLIVSNLFLNVRLQKISFWKSCLSIIVLCYIFKMQINGL